MTVAWLFDVDNTLTPSRGLMDQGFRDWFLDFQSRNDVYIVTGSDRPKTMQQVGINVVNSCQLVFSCCGNEVWRGDEIIHEHDWKGTPELLEALEHELDIASFRLRTGQHIEMRTGLINFSIIGRGATSEQRRQYVEYDSSRYERRSLASRLADKFHDLDFAIAGETGIDIYPKGRDKSQVLRWITADRTVFFGDATWPGGNDHPLYVKCTDAHSVTGWQETWDILKSKINLDNQRSRFKI